MIIHHGRKVLRELRGKTVQGKFKSFISKLFKWSYISACLSIVIWAGLCSGTALVGFN